MYIHDFSPYRNWQHAYTIMQWRSCSYNILQLIMYLQKTIHCCYSDCSYVIRSPAVLTTWNSAGRAVPAQHVHVSVIELAFWSCRCMTIARLIPLHSWPLCYLEYRIVPQAAKKTMADSFIFSECWACPATPFKVTKLWTQKSINSIPSYYQA